MTRRLVALGDSISCGQGVGVCVVPEQTWVGILADAMGAELELLARPGARTGDVRARQLPRALDRPASLATVLTGFNDAVNARIELATVADDLQSVVAALRAARVPILLVRLHDPSAHILAPARLRRRLLERIARINAAVDVASGPGVHVLDLADVAELRTRASWAVDRIHPNVHGHRAIAAAAVEVLARNGYDAAQVVGGPESGRPESRLAEVRWLVHHGAPYLVRKAAARVAFAFDQARTGRDCVG